MSTITFYLDDDSTEGVDFIPATLTFTLQMIKIYYIKFHLKKNKIDSYCVGGRHRSATKNIYGDITSKGNKC